MYRLKTLLNKIICKSKENLKPEMDISDITIDVVMQLWNGGGEVTLNDMCCNIISANLNINYNLETRKKFGSKGFPDCIIYKNGIPQSIIEFKLTKQSETLKRSLCQMLCYINNKYKNGIVPIKYLTVWTEEKVYKFDWNNGIDLLYENFKLYYKNETPTSYWDNCPYQISQLFKDINKLIVDEINIEDVNFKEITKKLVA